MGSLPPRSCASDKKSFDLDVSNVVCLCVLLIFLLPFPFEVNWAFQWPCDQSCKISPETIIHLSPFFIKPSVQSHENMLCGCLPHGNSAGRHIEDTILKKKPVSATRHDFTTAGLRAEHVVSVFGVDSARSIRGEYGPVAGLLLQSFVALSLVFLSSCVCPQRGAGRRGFLGAC